ncbi:archaemetzincin family Zn-dependent metalloprotease [Thermovibrio sp.]
MVSISLFGVGALLPLVEDEAERVIKEKFNLEPKFEGVVPPDATFSRGSQLLAEVQLENLITIKPEDSLFVGGITPYDIYSDDLNFVFGLALPFKGFVVSYARLLAEDLELFTSRLRKEITHELGHVFGLSHCPNPYCVMSFSNSLADVDRKGEDFCPSCKKKLEASMRKLNLL